MMEGDDEVNELQLPMAYIRLMAELLVPPPGYPPVAVR
jgi:hypothetical protein